MTGNSFDINAQVEYRIMLGENIYKKKKEKEKKKRNEKKKNNLQKFMKPSFKPLKMFLTLFCHENHVLT